MALLGKYAKTHNSDRKKAESLQFGFAEHSQFPFSKDIFAHAKRERNIDPEGISVMKTSNEPNIINEGYGSPLYVPGSRFYVSEVL